MFDIEQLKKFPTSPGVYLMKDTRGKILYVGKAKNLKSRLKQYFIPGRDGRVMVPFLAGQIAQIDTIVVSSEKEALILENNLIKKHQPKYNALLKDDKTFFSLMINHKHMWPMIRVVRYKGGPPSGNLYFGPYTHAHAARQTLELLRSLFPLRQCSDHELISRTRPCILYEMKKCIAPCVSKCTKQEYDAYVEQVIEFLKGHDSAILRDLKQGLQKAIENLEFEKADHLYKTISYIEMTLEKQKVENVGSEDLDILGIYRQADSVFLTQMLVRGGKLIASNEVIFHHNAQENSELLSSFILQHYGVKEELPHEILIPLTLKEASILESIVSSDKKRKMKIVSPKKGTKKALLEMAIQNAQIQFAKHEEEIHAKEQVLAQMEEMLRLTHFPERIECFDNSNLSGTEPVSAMVVFIGGEKSPTHYRKYKIKTGYDDYAALKEVLTRRYSKAKEEDNLPDLLVIDGGKGHLNVALSVLKELNVVTLDLISLAKEEGRHDKGITAEKIFLPSKTEPLELKPNSPVLFLLQQIRDEAHRFAISFQRKRREKASMKSVLDSLPGIGPIKKQRLLRHFKSLKRILEATVEELKAIKGITKKDIETIKALLKR